MAREFHNVREKFMQLCRQLARCAFLQKQVTNARKPVAVAKKIALTGFILSIGRENIPTKLHSRATRDRLEPIGTGSKRSHVNKSRSRTVPSGSVRFRVNVAVVYRSHSGTLW